MHLFQWNEGIKGQIFEGGHRIPLMMRWDNGPIPKAATRSHLIGLNDIFATLCQFADVPVPDKQGIDSIGFADYVQNVEATQGLRKYLGVWRFRGGIIHEESIRKDNLKLIQFRQSGLMSLYDLDKDIGETLDLIDDNSYKQDIDQMIVVLEAISPCYDNNNRFQVSDGKGSLQDRSCVWFKRDNSRCNDYPEGHIECRFTCGKGSTVACSFQPPTNPPKHISSSGLPKIQPSSILFCIIVCTYMSL